MLGVQTLGLYSKPFLMTAHDIERVMYLIADRYLIIPIIKIGHCKEIYK
jgi:hypothetical protein